MKKMFMTFALFLPILATAGERPGQTVTHCTNFRVDSGTFVDVREVDGNFVAYVTRMVNTMSKTETFPVVQGRLPVKRLVLSFQDELTAGHVFSLAVPVAQPFEESTLSTLKTQSREETLQCRIAPSFRGRI